MTVLKRVGYIPSETRNIPNPVNCEGATFTNPPVTTKPIMNKLARVMQLFTRVVRCLGKRHPEKTLRFALNSFAFHVAGKVHLKMKILSWFTHAYANS